MRLRRILDGASAFLPSDPVAKARLVKIAVIAVLAAVAVGLLWFAVSAILGDKPAQKAAQAQVDNRVATAAEQTHDFADHAMIEHNRENVTIKEKEVHYVETIRAAPGADNAIAPAVHDAGIAAIRGLRDASGDGQRDGAGLPASRP